MKNLLRIISKVEDSIANNVSGIFLSHVDGLNYETISVEFEVELQRCQTSISHQNKNTVFFYKFSDRQF